MADRVQITFHRLLPLLRWVKTIATWKTVIESVQSIGMDNYRVAFTRFLAFYSDNSSGLHDSETPAKWNGKVRQVSPLAPRPKPNGGQNVQRDLVAEGLNYTVICRRVCKCEPLFRINPLNLAKIVCFGEWVKGANCVSSDFLNEKVLMIVTYIILKIKAQLK